VRVGHTYLLLTYVTQPPNYLLRLRCTHKFLGSGSRFVSPLNPPILGTLNSGSPQHWGARGTRCCILSVIRRCVYAVAKVRGVGAKCCILRLIRCVYTVVLRGSKHLIGKILEINVEFHFCRSVSDRSKRATTARSSEFKLYGESSYIEPLDCSSIAPSVPSR